MRMRASGCVSSMRMLRTHDLLRSDKHRSHGRMLTPHALHACNTRQLDASVPQDEGIEAAVKIAYRLREDEPVYGSCVMSGRFQNNTRCAQLPATSGRRSCNCWRHAPRNALEQQLTPSAHAGRPTPGCW